MINDSYNPGSPVVTEKGQKTKNWICRVFGCKKKIEYRMYDKGVYFQNLALYEIFKCKRCGIKETIVTERFL